MLISLDTRQRYVIRIAEDGRGMTCRDSISAQQLFCRTDGLLSRGQVRQLQRVEQGQKSETLDESHPR